MLLLTLRGTPTIYYGDEIGMEQAQIPPDRIRDPVERNVPGQGLGRDGCRTPMQWDDSPHAGFTSAEPWLPLQETWRENNVAAELSDPDSLLNLHRALIWLRRRHPVLVAGSHGSVVAEEGILLFTRTLETTSMLIALNFDYQPTVLMTKAEWPAGTICLSSYLDRYDERMADGINLRPLEGVVVEFQ
jgi:alpha-glucosidase